MNRRKLYVQICGVIILIMICARLVSCFKLATGADLDPKYGEPAEERLEDFDFISTYVSFSHDEATDTYTISLDKYTEFDDLSELFKEMDRAFKGAYIGNLVIEAPDLHSYESEYLSKLIGELPCKGIQCLDVSRIKSFWDGRWMDILPVTKSLFEPDLTHAALARLGQVNRIQKILISGYNSAYDTTYLPHFTGLEEISLSAGLTSNDQEETRKSIDEAQEQDAARTAFSEEDYLPGINLFQHFGELENLDRVLFFPELEEWAVDDRYYIAILGLQTYAPEVFTNPAGKSWDGDEESLIPVTDIDVSKRAEESELVAAALAYCQQIKASSSNEEDE